MRMHYGRDYIDKKEGISILYRKTGMAVKAHQHDYVEIVYILKGYGVHTIDYTDYIMSDGSIFIIVDSDCPHSLSFVDETEYFDILMTYDYFSSVCSSFTDAKNLINFCDNSKNKFFITVFQNTIRDSLTQVFRQAFDEFENKNVDYLSVIKRYMEIVLLHTSRAIRIGNLGYKRNLDWVLPQITDYINKKYRENITLQDIAKKYSYNPNYFCKLFKERYGTTYYEYIHDKRIKFAKNLLRNTEHSIDMIAQMSGYTNKTYFYKIFEKKTGMTPKQFRLDCIKRREEQSNFQEYIDYEHLKY